MTWRAYTEDSLSHAGVTLRIASFQGDTISEVTNLTLAERPEGTYSDAGPLLYGPNAIGFMQAVMDAAYAYGLRPSQSVDDAAMKEHLKDMREMTRHLLKMNNA